VQQLGDGLALGRGEVLRRRGGAGFDVAAAAAGEQRRAEGGEREQGGEASGVGAMEHGKNLQGRLKLGLCRTSRTLTSSPARGHRPGSGPFGRGSATSWEASGSGPASGNCRPARRPTPTTSITPTRSFCS